MTDVLGLTSSFSYRSDHLVQTLTRPYGVTRFDEGAYSGPVAQVGRWVAVTDALGGRERVEYRNGAYPSAGPYSDPEGAPAGLPVGFNQHNLNASISFWWDKRAMLLAVPGCRTLIALNRVTNVRSQAPP